MATRPPQSQPSLHLSTILNLHPTQDHKCIGIAYTQGRRCHAGTNPRGRRAAISLLEQGTEDLHAGRCIDDLLEDLAPYVLCTRWHQGQAAGVVRGWRGRVECFWGEEGARSRVMTHSSEGEGEGAGPGSGSRQDPGLDLDLYAACCLLERRLEACILEFERMSGLHLHPGQFGTLPGTTTTTTQPTPTAPSTQHADTATANLATPVPQTTEHIPTPASIPRENEVTRRPIEGECNICLVALRSVRSERVYQDDHVERDEGEEGEEEEEEELSWCKGQCGVNYHKTCIDEWLATATHGTCPTCRCGWIV